MIKRLFGRHKPGILDEKPSPLLYDYETLCGSSASNDIEIPEEFMLPQDRIPTCRDQKTTSQCAAFATAGILEILNYVETNERTLFSTTYIYGRHRKYGLRTVTGTFLSSLLTYLTFLGSVPNDMMPQLYENPKAYDFVREQDINALDRIASKTRIAGYVSLKDKHGNAERSIENIKKALLKYQIPILGGIKCFDGKHAIAIVGWDKTRVYYMNSWGLTAGKKGICSFRPNVFCEAYLLLDAKNMPTFPFVDVPEEHWAYHAINRCYSAGIINGIDSNHFSPDTPLTRAHIAQALYNYAQKWSVFNGKEFVDANTVINLVDVTPEKWFYKAVNYCVSKGIFNKTGSLFSPDETLSRSEFCKVIFEFMRIHATGKKYKEILAYDMEKIAVDFEDVSKYDEDYEAIMHCYHLGLINGVTATKFMPNNSLTRAHLCQIIYKSIKLLEEYEVN